MMRKPVLLCSAQMFGYGPMSKLLAVARVAARSFDTKLLLTSTQHALHNVNPGVFSETISAEADGGLESVIKHIAPDAVLSSYESNVVFAARRCGLTTYFIDGLFWFWRLSRDFSTLAAYGQRLLEANNSCLRTVLDDLTPHERVFLAHFLASRSYVQRDSGFRDRFHMLRDHVDVKMVGAIVHADSEDTPRSDNHVLVTLSGGIHPTSGIEGAVRYTQFALNLIRNVAAVQFRGWPWIVLVNPHVLEHLKPCPENANPGHIRIVASVCQDEMLALEKKAIVVFCPPGLTTVCECARLKVPVVFLPEQHIQYKNAYRLRELRYPLLGVLMKDVLGNDVDEDTDPDALQAVHNEMLPWAVQNIHVFSEAMVNAFSRLKHAPQRRSVATQQRRAVQAMTGDFGGAEQVVADLSAQAAVAVSARPGGGQLNSRLSRVENKS